MSLVEMLYVIQNIESPVFTDKERQEAIERYLLSIIPQEIAEKIFDFAFDKKGNRDEWSWS